MASHLKTREGNSVPAHPRLPGVRHLHHALSALLLLLTVAARQGSADPLYAKLPPDTARAFSWFDRLGFPDVKGCKFVRVGTGAFWTRDDGEPPEGERIEAFLTEAKPNGEFTVLTLALLTEHYECTPAGTPPHDSVFFKELPLEEWAEKRLHALQNPRDGDDDGWEDRFLAGITDRAKAFVVAWGCARNGHPAIAQRLYEHAAGMPGPDRSDTRARPRHSGFPRTFKEDIGNVMMWQAVLACGDPSISREELLERFERFITHCPSSEHVPWARETAAMLKRMIKEDREHAGKKLKSLARMSTEERVAELIFQLREQSGNAPSGTRDIFENRAQETDTPARQLMAIGHAAVPQLIAALGDKRLTRSIGYWKSFYFSHRVLRVGEYAHAILWRIAGRPFYVRADTTGHMMEDEMAASREEQVREWWAAIQEKGEKQVLIEATAIGDETAVYQAQALLERYPDAAFAAIEQGILNAKGCGERARLVSLVAGTEGDAAIPVLIREMEKAQSQNTRVAAAAGLRSRGDERGVQGMVREWAVHQPAIRRFKGGMGDDEEWCDVRIDRLIALLAVSDSPMAIKAMADKLMQRPPRVKTRVVESMAEGTASRFSHYLWPRPSEPSKPATLLEIEALLVAALADTGEARHDQIYPKKELQRICDVAGHTLAARWPEKYRFNTKASPKQRDRQRTNCINIWRKEKKLPLLPMPMERPVRRACKEKTEPLLKAILSSQGGGEADRALGELAELGLPALPAAVETLATLVGHPLQDRVAALASTLSCTVVEASFSCRSLNPSKELSDLLHGIEGRPLTSASCDQLLREMIGKCPRGTRSVCLSVRKDEDLTGIAVEAEFLGTSADATTADNRSEGLRWDWTGRVASSGFSRHSYGHRGDWNDGLDKALCKAIAKALAVGPTEHVRIRIRLERTE